MPIKAILWDCDGTLVDSEVISLKVLVDLVAHHGLSIPPQQAVEEWSGCDLHEVIEEIGRRLGKPLPANFIDTFREHQLARLAVDVQPVAFAESLLTGMSLPYCVASNAPQNKIRLCLQTTGLLPYVDPNLIFSAYDIQAWKPKPDLFLLAAERLGVAPKACAVVEDSGVGIDAGLAAGMVVFGYDPHHRLPSRPGVIEVSCLDQLRPIFHR